ncbi:MAG: Gldg family protein [Planctomycetota bacterium]|nr:Gldg family protein [Planctomycetota bacterium]
MNRHILIAIFKRNFVSYFSSPIGYVFICAFVLLSAFAAFWPNEFFNANLANLGQLNKSLPWIMLVFIPAVTMSIWAQERQQGTDELLLTLPASDLDVVIGKYLAALAIFTVSLLFSLSNIIVLIGLGKPDLGLLAANYVGYWYVGAAMLSVGMVASFLTKNLTVSFVLAVAFNVPLVFAAFADVILGRETALVIKSFSIAEQFSDFGRGVITLSGVTFFGSIVAVMLYLSMALIGRRHWAGRRQGIPMPGHIAVRCVSLAAVAIGLNVLGSRFDQRLDITSERLSSLSPHTRELLTPLRRDRPVYIEAYVSSEVPQQYVQTRFNLLSKLREVDSIGGDGVIVRINDTEHYSTEAAEAQEQFGITARPVGATAGGRLGVEDIFLGVAFMCGLDKVVVPFVDRGLPVEYEVVRSIATVSQQRRKKIGVLMTDARLYGGFDIQTMTSRPNQPIIDELQKQYEVVTVDPAGPITERYDALLAVQPSSLPPRQLDNFLDAVRSGQPTAIFEDPFPFLDSNVPATSQPRRAPGGNNPFMQRQPPEPKGDISELWSLLGVEFRDREVVWDTYNPYPKLVEVPPEFVFVGAGSGAEEPFNQTGSITSGLQQVLLVFPGAIEPQIGSTLTFAPLLRAGAQTGVIAFDEILQRSFFGQGGLNPNRRFRPTHDSYILAAHIQGQLPVDSPTPPQETGSDIEKPAKPNEANVVLVADIDMLYSVFFALRARGEQPEALNLNLDNVTFVLNVLDELAGDDRFIEIRKRRPIHRTLTAVEMRTEQARQIANAERERFIREFEASRTKEQRKLQERIDELQQREGIDSQQMVLEIATAQQVGQRRLDAAIEQLEAERDRQLEVIERELVQEVRRVERTFKLEAVALPPILPLAVAIVVSFRRRKLERVGLPQARRK